MFIYRNPQNATYIGTALLKKVVHIMNGNNSIQLFEDEKIRTAWDAEKEEWYFSVVDVVAVLTDSADPKQ